MTETSLTVGDMTLHQRDEYRIADTEGQGGAVHRVYDVVGEPLKVYHIHSPDGHKRKVRPA